MSTPDPQAAPEVLYAVEGGVARLTLNRPDKRNPLSPSVIGLLITLLERARDDESVHVAVITGAGKVFSAGGDLSAMGNAGASGGAGIAGTLPDLFLLIQRLGKPVVAMVNGHALAGGCGLVAACHLAIASDEATLGTPEINVGLWPMMIMAVIFRNVGRKRGLELVLTGDRISAREAAEMGLVNRAVPADRLEAETAALCAKLASKSTKIVQLGLDGFHAAEDLALEPALAELQQRFLGVLATDDAKEGLMAFLQKRAPVWTGK